jgi:hypothetical protein
MVTVAIVEVITPGRGSGTPTIEVLAWLGVSALTIVPYSTLHSATLAIK